MKHIIKSALFFSLVMLGFNGCKKDETTVTPPPPDNEYLSTVKLVAINTTDSSDIHTAKWVQLDPTGLPDTSFAKLTLKKNATYNVSVYFEDETKNPVESITTEVRDRANYHLVCFDVASGLTLTVQRTDHDTNVPALELGLTNLFTTGNVSTGKLGVSLHHQPNIKNGNCDIGSTDVDVDFTVDIQ